MNPIALLSNIMIQVLVLFNALCFGQYGLAIILLTLAVNLALYPLTLQSSVSMAALQKIQPKMKELQDKHKEDPATMQKEIMALYKNEKINPLGGCLPMLLKIPFFIALFFALQSPEFKALIAAPGAIKSFLWMPDLTIPDHTYVMVVLIGLSTYLSQKLMPGSDNPQTKTMNQIMPFMIAFISLPFAAGVQLYWVSSNVFTAIQQYFINKKL
jgi:YidC/Oxa1 family membrane protein insertase